MGRVFAIPAMPGDLKRVQAMDGSDEVFVRDGNYWKDSDGYRYAWDDMIHQHAGVIEVEKTPAEQAVEFFEKYGCDPAKFSLIHPNFAVTEHLKILVKFAKEN